MKVIFMGTPDFAVPTLEALIKSKHEVICVVTQPDKESGRNRKVVMSPVKSVAMQNGIDILQPSRIRNAEEIEKLKKYDADIAVVAAFGQILPAEILDMPRHGCINVHASLLPKYRGAAPIQYSILEGDEKTGITIMQMDVGCDTGDIILQEELAISPDDTGGSMFEKLSKLGADALLKALDMIESGACNPVPQDNNKATHCGKLNKDMGHINWSEEASHIERLIRALNPWPGAYSMLDGDTVKIWESHVLVEDEEVSFDNAALYENGEIARADKNGFYVKCSDGFLVVTMIQMPGKKRVSVHDYLLGHKVSENVVLK